MYSTGKLFGNKVTGGTKRFLELYYGMVDKGIEVDLFCADSMETLKEKNISANLVVNEKISKNLFLPTSLLVFLKNYDGIRRLKAYGYDKVIVFDVPTAVGLSIVGVKNLQLFIRQNLIEYKSISARGRTTNKILIKIYLFFMGLCEAICLIKADKIFIQCNYDYSALINRHRTIKHTIKKKSVVQINNVNPSWIIEDFDKSQLDKNIPREYKLFCIGFVGGFNGDRKGQRLFVDALKNLLKKGVMLEGILVGDGDQLPQYKVELQNYPMIKFTGRLKNPFDVIKKLDMLVVPSLADSCPNTIMEALYSEIPVIGARSGGIPEILNNETWLFEPNSASLQDRIEYFLSGGLLSQLKKEQRVRKKELEFDWVDIIVKHLEL